MLSFAKKNPENSFNIAKNQKFELITSHHFKNLISPKPAWKSHWGLIPLRNLKRQHHCPYSLPIFQFFFNISQKNQ